MVHDSLISIVTDSATCARIALAYARAARSDTVNLTQLYLLRVGPTRYVADYAEHVGEYSAERVFDSNYVMLRLILK